MDDAGCIFVAVAHKTKVVHIDPAAPCQIRQTFCVGIFFELQDGAAGFTETEIGRAGNADIGRTAQGSGHIHSGRNENSSVDFCRAFDGNWNTALPFSKLAGIFSMISPFFK